MIGLAFLMAGGSAPFGWWDGAPVYSLDIVGLALVYISISMRSPRRLTTCGSSRRQRWSATSKRADSSGCQFCRRRILGRQKLQGWVDFLGSQRVAARHESCLYTSEQLAEERFGWLIGVSTL